MLTNILEMQPIMKENFSPELKNLLLALLQKEPEHRLGSGTDDAEEIKRHEWFRGVDWNEVLRRQNPAPIVP